MLASKIDPNIIWLTEFADMYIEGDKSKQDLLGLTDINIGY